jgi:beta-galactosidase
LARAAPAGLALTIHAQEKSGIMRGMKAFFAFAAAVTALALVACSTTPFLRPLAQRPRRTIALDADWRWVKGDAPGAQAAIFNDATWAKEDLPYDWAIAGPVDQNNPTGRGGGYMPSGVSWHRKNFTLPSSDQGKRVFVQFDGVMGVSDAWINGFHLGRHAYGYSSFQYELTGHLAFGKDRPNVLAVKADTTVQPDSRWYTGQGIYRHVRLAVTRPVHFDQWGVFVTTPKASADAATARVEATVVNQGDAPATVSIHASLKDPSGKASGLADSEQATIAAGAKTTLALEIPVSNPRLWDVTDPALYKITASVVADGGTATDAVTVPFGIRAIEFKADTGFWLNGKNVKLLGACVHHDGGALGAAVPKETWRRRLQALKDVGVNAIRTAHNPPSPEFMDLCDRMGMLVMLESFDTWTAAKPHAERAYNLRFRDNWKANLTEVVKRDRNHPSVVIYSAGNEIHDNLGRPAGRKEFVDQRDLIRSLDPTRPVTLALLRPRSQNLFDNGFVELMDVVGVNYRTNELIDLHRRKPFLKTIDTEEKHTAAAWTLARDAPFIAGLFVWTGVDYLGEADWPSIARGNAMIDRTGQPRALGLQRQSWWTSKPVVHLARVGGFIGGAADAPAATDNTQARQRQRLPDWSPWDVDAGTSVTVEAYSNCDRVELFLNGKSLGAKPLPADAAARSWGFPYADGELKAIGSNGGKPVAEETLRTAGKPVRIVLSTDHAGALAHAFDDVAYVTATLVDVNGVRVPWADKLVQFQVEGPGAIAGVDNADVKSHESYQGNRRHAYDGRCVAIVRSTANHGRIALSASTDGLQGDALTLKAGPPPHRRP